MSQHVEIFFANPPDNSVEAVLMPLSKDGPNALQIAFAYRLVGRYAVMDPIIGEQWTAVVVSSPEFAKANQARPQSQRPNGTRLCFLAVAGPRQQEAGK